MLVILSAGKMPALQTAARLEAGVTNWCPAGSRRYRLCFNFDMLSYNIGPVIVPEFLSDTECAQLRNYFRTAKKVSGRLRASNETTPQIRKSTICWLHETKRASWIYGKIRELMLTINEQHYRFEVTALQPIQLTQYKAREQGEFYNSHVDICMAATGTQRKLSLSIQLSPPEDYEGGSFHLFGDENERIVNPTSLQDKLIRRRQLGTAIVFPSFFVHEVTPVSKGTRYSLVAWMEGPNWK